MKRLLKKKKKLISQVFLLVALSAAFFGHTKPVLAVINPDPGGNGLGSTAPAVGSGRNYSGDPGLNYMGAGTTVTPFYDVGNNANDYTYSSVVTRVYVHSGSTYNITVTNYGSNCYQYSGGGVVGPDYTENGQAPTMIYSIYGSGNTLLRTTNVTGGGCNNFQFTGVSGSSAYSITPVPDYDGFFEVRAQVSTSSQGTGENSYRITTDTTSSGNLEGDVGAGSTVFGLGYRAGNLNDGNYWAGWTTFALPMSCNSLNNPFPQDTTVQYLDTDTNHTDGSSYWNQDMIFVLQKQLINPDNSVGSWTDVETQRQTSGQIGNPNGQFQFTAYSNYRYRIILANVGVRNTIRVIIPSPMSTLYSALNERPNLARCVGVPTCKAWAQTLTPANGANDPITVVLKNSSPAGGPSIPAGYQLRQVLPNGGAFTLNSALGPQQTISFTFNPTPRTNQYQQFNYALFDSTTGSTSVGNNPLCGVGITWGNAPTQGDLQISCTDTTVPVMTSTITTTTTTNNPLGPGWTTDTPINNQFGATPHTWASQPTLSNPPSTAVPKPVAGNDYIYNPGLGGFTITYWWTGGGSYQSTSTSLVTSVQFKIHFDGSNGSQNDFFDSTSTNPGGKYYGSTFGQFGFLLPQYSYTATLSAHLTDPNVWTPVGSPHTFGPCLKANTPPDTPDACGGGTGASVEVGQPSSVSYTFVLNNLANVDFSGRGFQMLFQPADPNAMQVTSANPAPVNIGAGAGYVSVFASFNIIVNYSSNYSVSLLFNGQLLNFLGDDGWTGQCPGQPITANALPYLQAWNGSVSTGGGFRSPGSNDSGSCDQTAPSYVSPVTYGGNQDYGGIRAFGRQSSDRGSRVDFGALALGMIIGAPGGDSNNAGFFSGDSAASDRMDYANTLGGYFSGNMGGYLNSNSTGHCASDFYTNTQVSPSTSTGSLSGDLADCISKGGRCQYDFSNLPGALTDSNVVIPAGVQITIYVNHSITIDGNITYANFNPNDQTSVPYFALIVKGGDITLTRNVNRLDGLYVVQPSGGGGDFITCDDVCNNQLVVNGAVIAQHVKLLRNHGTLDNPAGPSSAITGNPAEIFNFVPSLIIGQPAFAAEFGSPESVISLPPVF